MNLEDYRVPGAKENPIQTDKLPREKRALIFPVSSDSVVTDRHFVRDVWAAMLFNGFWVVMLVDGLYPTDDNWMRGLPWFLMLVFLSRVFHLQVDVSGSVHRFAGLVPLAFFVVGGMVYPFLNPFGPTLWILAAMVVATTVLTLSPRDARNSTFTIGMAMYSLPVGLALLLAIFAVELLDVRRLLVPIGVVLLAIQGVAFRMHTVERTVVGMLDEQTARRFRIWKRGPQSLTPKPRLTAIFAAVRCYLSYNRGRIRVPGIFRSPAGSIRLRLGMTVASIAVLSAIYYIEAFALAKYTLALTMHSRESAALCRLVLLLACPLGAIVTWYLAMFAFTARFVGRAIALTEKQMSSSHWRRMLDRLDASPNGTERQSLWLGNVACDQSPILYPIKKLFTHSWVAGSSGSGKTAWLMALVDQVMYRTDIRVVVVDCKAHNSELLPVMQQAAAARAARTGISFPVKHFTLSEARSTYLLDLFSQSWWKKLPTPQRTGTILSALSLNYASVYGAAYFRDAAYEFTAFVLDRNPAIASWNELAARMQDAIRFAKEPWELSKRCKEDGEHIVWIVKRLASLSALNNVATLPQTVRDNAVDFGTGHHYFALNARENGLITGEVGRLIAACVLASSYANPGGKTLLVLDEWQLMVTHELEELLTQARDLGVGCVLANQNAAQLKTKDADLVPIVEGNASLQVWMKVTDTIGREQLRRLGGQRVEVSTSIRKRSGEETTFSFSEALHDRVNDNLISEVSSDPRSFLIRLTDNSELACYGDLVFAAKSMFHQTKQQYEAMCGQSWPSLTAETLANRNALPRNKPPGGNQTQTVGPKPGQRTGHRLGQPNTL